MEQGLSGFGVCNLASLNLVNFVNSKGEIKTYELEDHVRAAVRFLDEVIDMNTYTLPEIEEKQKRVRRIGLGTMGLADAMLLSKIKYGSEESLNFIDKIYSLIRNTAYDESVELAKEKGQAPAFKEKEFLNGTFIKELPDWLRNKIKMNGIRNLAILTQAPTGSTGLLAGVSSGIEPNFSWSYIRDDALGEREINHWLIEQQGYQVDDLPSYFVSSMELTPQQHVKVQARIQKYLDTSISKTVNAPESYSVEDTKELYMLAYDLGCKGITYYRNNSRTGVLKTKEEEKQELGIVKPVKRPSVVDGTTTRENTGCGKIYLTLNIDTDKNPIETFISSGSDGGCSLMYDGISRMISLALRSGVPVEEVIEQLKSVDSCPSCLYRMGEGKTVSGSSCPDIIGKALENLIGGPGGTGNRQMGLEDIIIREEDIGKNPCPECGKDMELIEGCQTCRNCGYSKCG